jgi:hypothetical protein
MLDIQSNINPLSQIINQNNEIYDQSHKFIVKIYRKCLGMTQLTSGFFSGAPTLGIG